MAKLKHSLRSYFKTPIFSLEKNFICFSGNLYRKKTIFFSIFSWEIPFFGQFMNFCTLNELFVNELLLKNEMSDQKKYIENTKKNW